MLEIEASRLALQRSQNPQVRQYAQQLISDHQLANQQLRSMAQQQGLQMPQQLDQQHQQKLQQLQNLSGPTFDAQYARLMARTHDDAIALFQQASQSREIDQNLQGFAGQMLPTLQAHTRTAHQIRQQSETRAAESPQQQPPPMQR